MTKNEWMEVARTVIASRLIDTIEETELAPSGKVTYQFSAKGHELAQVILGQALRHGHDGATVYYRSRPFVIAAGMTYEESFAGPLALSGSRSGGRDIGVVHHLPNTRGVTVLPASGDVGAQYTPCVGWAQAITYRTRVMKDESWTGAVAVAMGGDGSTATNGFWAALNIATTVKLPMIFFIEDNQYGISVPGTFQTPGGNIADNLAAFKNLRIVEVDGTSPEEADRLITKTIEHVRQSQSPALLRVRVPRICGHSGADNQSYKTQEQKDEELSRDPIVKLKEFFERKKYLDNDGWLTFVAEVESSVRAACEAALAQPQPTPEDSLTKSFFDGTTPRHGGMMADGVEPPSSNGEKVEDGPRVNLIEAVKRTLDNELRHNDRIVVFGEDVGVKGGVHGATVDLQIKHGADRVFDTSLSEEGIIGRAVGMAMAGLVPVPEIQFRKYLDPATEQINDAGTIRWRTNGDFAAPMVVRIPVGFSKRTGDPWHSVSGESIFAHTIGWRVAMPSNAQDAVGLLRTALRGNDPTFFLEHRAIQDTAPGRGIYPGDDYLVPFGVANIIRPGTRATVVAWGEMVHRAKSAVEQLGEDIEVIDLRTIVPWDRETVVNSVRRTNRCMVLHEDTITCGFGAEIASTITSDCFQYLDAPVIRLAPPDIPIPYNKGMMDAVIPTVERVATELRELLAF
ncbi:MAG: pyruvate dehydrogenase [Ignavibacteria bacterium]|nr:pyruvate dehydrogenase [Ignavibacteria bacterium]MBP7092626.1 pyruvate dehydrogenase [Candidatus Kapabacteria bacterium]MBK6760891.1 pyruvate dehydrogenase [Ignavibacteria bacterium]MBK7031901.1 pyruvate dehydrogenase [Ignavibacteria bacterium]MBK7185501.1 pyruvate dehydrogenase [Ignavibacteria bacterium]